MSRLQYEIEGDDDKVMILTLKKWSIRKALSLVRELSDIASELGLSVSNLDSEGFSQVMEKLATASEKATARIASVIRTTVVEPTLTEDEILEWGLDDFSGVVAAILDQNFNEKLLKNFDRLKGTAIGRMLSSPTDDAPSAPSPRMPQATPMIGGFQQVPLHPPGNGDGQAIR